MVVEQTSQEVVIRFPLSAEMTNTQDFIDSLRYRELTARCKTDQSEVDVLAREVNKSWWEKNKGSFAG